MAVQLLPLHRWRIIALCNLLFGAWPVLAFEAAPNFASISRAFSLHVVVLLLFAGYAKLALRIWKRVPIAPLLIAGIGGAVLFSGGTGSGKTLLQFFLLGIWHNSFYFQALGPSRNFDSVDFLVCQKPFFSIRSPMAILPAPPLLSDCPLAADRGDAFRAAIRLLLAAFVGTLFFQLISHQATGTPMLLAALRPHDMPGGGLYTAEFGDFALWERWCAILLSFSVFLIKMLVAYGIEIACCRMMGFEVEPPIDAPWAARTLSQFFYRSNVYFAKLLTAIFVMPTARRLCFIKNSRTRAALALATGILLAGPFCHFFLGNIHQPMAQVLRNMSVVVPFWLLVGAAWAASMILEGGKGVPGNKIYLRTAAYFAICAVLQLLSYDLDRNFIPLQERLMAITRLFKP